MGCWCYVFFIVKHTGTKVKVDIFGNVHTISYKELCGEEVCDSVNFGTKKW